MIMSMIIHFKHVSVCVTTVQEVKRMLLTHLIDQNITCYH